MDGRSVLSDNPLDGEPSTARTHLLFVGEATESSRFNSLELGSPDQDRVEQLQSSLWIKLNSPIQRVI